MVCTFFPSKCERHLPVTVVNTLHRKNSKLYYNKIFIGANTLILIFLYSIMTFTGIFILESKQKLYMSLFPQ